jgi:HSP20 family protein
MAIERSRPLGTTMGRWQPLRGVSDLQSEMNRLFDSVFGHPAAGATGERIWAPLCDMWETRDDVVVSFDLPGATEKDVNVSITGDLLSVKGERRFVPEAGTEDSWHRLERAYGKFERAVQLPMPVDADKVTAMYRDGVLTVRLPKAEEMRSRQIRIDTR